MSELTEMTKLVRRIAIATEKLAAATERRSADSTAVPESPDENYNSQMRALFMEYLLKAVAEKANTAECYRLARELLKEHDALVLSFDPFAKEVQ